MHGHRAEPEEELDTQIVGVVQDAKYTDVKDEVPPVFFTPVPAGLGDRLPLLLRAHRASIRPRVLRDDPGAGDAGSTRTCRSRSSKTLEQQVTRERLPGPLHQHPVGRLRACWPRCWPPWGSTACWPTPWPSAPGRSALRMALGAGSGNVRRMVLRQVAPHARARRRVGVAGRLRPGPHGRNRSSSAWRAATRGGPSVTTGSGAGGAGGGMTAGAPGVPGRSHGGAPVRVILRDPSLPARYTGRRG